MPGRCLAVLGDGTSTFLEVLAETLMGQFYELFAGAGTARAGLGTDRTRLFANDIDPKKAASYVDDWGGPSLGSPTSLG